MPALTNDRIKETATTTGTSNFTLAGAPTAFQTFASRYSVGDPFPYCIQASTASTSAGQWEVGIGTLSSTVSLVRNQVLQSSNSDALVNFGTGSKDVFVTIPSKWLNSLTANGEAIHLSRCIGFM